ncbi:MAG TPA: ATP synthase F1 subunit delta [candidate division Zixibacteria bacterium]
MIESRIARKYAAALFSSSKRIRQVESISADLETISDLLRKLPHLKSFLESPQILEKEKEELITATFKGRISEALFSFLLLVLNKHRIPYLLPMAEEFKRLVKEDQGIISARLISARQMEPSLNEQIKTELEKSSGKKVEIETQLDPNLIGGMIIILGDRIIDRSIRHQLSQLKEQMSALRVY